MDLFKIGSNIASMQALNSLYKLNSKLSVHQERLSTGKRVNSAQDDTAAYSIASTLKNEIRSNNSYSRNARNAEAVLNILEGSMQKQLDILQKIRTLAIKANDIWQENVTSGFEYYQVYLPVVNQAMQLLNELTAIGESTSFNGISLMNSAQTLTFKVGKTSDEDISINLKKLKGGFENGELATDAEFSDLEGFDNTPEIEQDGNLGYVTAINNIDNAIAVVISEIQNVRSTQERLANRKEFIDTKNEKVEAVRSTYEDADFAKEQMELMKVQILQQTATAALAQANSAPQSVLSLFR